MKFLVSLFLFISISSIAQDVKLPVVDNKIEYGEVVQVDSANAIDLYSRSKLVIANVFKSAKDVTQLTDDNTKTIIAKGLIPVDLRKALASFYGNVRFKLTIQCKDNRYKYSFNDFIAKYNLGSRSSEEPLEATNPDILTKKMWAQIKEQVDASVKSIIVDMKKQMGMKTNDW